MTSTKQMENFSESIVKNEDAYSMPGIDIKTSNLAEESYNQGSSIALFENLSTTLQNDLSTDRFLNIGGTPLFAAEMEA